MGSEFIQKTRKRIKKSLDMKRVALATPDLLTQRPDQQPRCISATRTGNKKIGKGEECIVERKGNMIVLSCGNNEVGLCESPPPDVVRAIDEGGGAIFGEVRRVSKIGNNLEIALC